MADEISLEFLAQQQSRILDGLRTLDQKVTAVQRDMDMLVRIVLRLDDTANALREDIKSLWLAERDLRERIERAERRLEDRAQ